MAATKLQMNWTAVGFTPSGGSLTSITKVTNVHFDPGVQLLGFSGDSDRYMTTKVNQMNDPKAVVTGGDIATMQSLGGGTIGTLTATHSDAKGAALGAIVYTLINAVVGNAPGGGAHAAFGEGSVHFESFSSDGVTSSLSFTRV